MTTCGGVNPTYSRFALIKEVKSDGDGDDPFASSKSEADRTFYYLSVQRVLIEGKFQEKQRFGVGVEQGETFELLGKHMTAAVGYPLVLPHPRVDSTRFTFGYKMEGYQGWAYGEGAMPQASYLRGVIPVLNRLPSSKAA